MPHAVRLEAARSYCEHVADRLDSGDPGLQVEGAIAKLFSSEAGNQAADAAIQAHGGYGYAHEYEVEKIRRDVRITTIYEGTSEILQNIIGAHRWRATVKTKGGFYRDLATTIRDTGGDENAALAAEAMAETFLVCHSQKLPRQQFFMFELARLAAEVETAATLAIKACRDNLENSRFIKECAGLHARAVARDVAQTGARMLRASSKFNEEEIAAYSEAINTDKLMRSAEGELEAMGRVVDLLYAE